MFPLWMPVGARTEPDGRRWTAVFGPGGLLAPTLSAGPESAQPLTLLLEKINEG